MNLVLRRAAAQPDPGCTRGQLTCEGLINLHSIELPWRDNEPNVSCVPEGVYDLLPYDSPKHGATWRLHNPALNICGKMFVPEGCRSEIEIHADNFARTLEGCIGVGLSAGELLDDVTGRNETAVIASVAAMLQLRALLGSQQHTLTIILEVIP